MGLEKKELAALKTAVIKGIKNLTKVSQKNEYCRKKKTIRAT